MLRVEEHLDVYSIAAAAIRALAHLDAESLEGLALRCEALSRSHSEPAMPSALNDVEIGELKLAVLARVIAVSRANLNVLRQSSAMPTARLEYGESSSVGGFAGA